MYRGWVLVLTVRGHRGLFHLDCFPACEQPPATCRTMQVVPSIWLFVVAVLFCMLYCANFDCVVAVLFCMLYRANFDCLLWLFYFVCFIVPIFNISSQFAFLEESQQRQGCTTQPNLWRVLHWALTSLPQATVWRHLNLNVWFWKEFSVYEICAEIPVLFFWLCYNYMLSLRFSSSSYQVEQLQMSSSPVCTVALWAHSHPQLCWK